MAGKESDAPGPGAKRVTKKPERLARKAARVTETLERLYGTPRRSSRGKVLDSLVGCILSQNTNDANSTRAWRSLKEAFPTWEAAAAAPRSRLERAIRAGGLAPSKSRRIKEILAFLKRTRGGYDLEFLRDMADDEAFDYLESLNGVGKKTAAVVLLFACGRDVFPVDTHIHRIAQRLGLAPEGATRDEVFRRMGPLVPRGKAHCLHVNLLRFGRERCSKRLPRCEGCPLRRECLFVKGRVTF